VCFNLFLRYPEYVSWLHSQGTFDASAEYDRFVHAARVLHGVAVL
jgi:hypothetical protein